MVVQDNFDIQNGSSAQACIQVNGVMSAIWYAADQFGLMVFL